MYCDQNDVTKVWMELTCWRNSLIPISFPRWSSLHKCRHQSEMAAVFWEPYLAAEVLQSVKKERLRIIASMIYKMLTLLSRSSSFRSHSKSLYLRRTLDSLTRNTGRFVCKWIITVFLFLVKSLEVKLKNILFFSSNHLRSNWKCIFFSPNQ